CAMGCRTRRRPPANRPGHQHFAASTIAEVGMTSSDRDLGMDRSITRRDFLNGVSVAVGGAMVTPRSIGAEETMQPPAARSAATHNYPPALTGMRGSGPGMMDVGHAMRDGKTWEAGEDTGESYDLVVVGGGMSGLAAAFFF